ncbi:MAG: hypothetical protein KBH81_09705 [Phycisphaerae bacterium]|jgi:hypothetical protein|nr:hypothetical protein [Phycisphaerae bacterium]HOO16102.1 hypothetical protein [Phycisphaerae bacterium]HPC22345.1 hypothetical protein [Phycisphaerae bacterium]HRS27747.1 hypothetical protein [Phycisphaerae bacterium]HRT41688.1 hypothetical protein [Phycisphaerae bacterium]
MKCARIAAALILLVVTLGSLTVSGGYAWYYRSDRYRRQCVADLSAALGLPCDIGRVLPRARCCREYNDVAVWLPDRRDKVLSCPRALLTRLNDAADERAYEMRLLGGACEISTRTWLREDYRRVVESGLRLGFAPDGPRQIIIQGMDLRFIRDDFVALLEDATGSVTFDSHERGRASIQCRSLNGYASPESITLTMRFSPLDGGVQIDELTLHAPNLPLNVLGLGALTGLLIESGRFSGQLAYSEADGRRRVTLAGRCYDLSLPECTAGFASPGWRGAGREIQLQELTFIDGRPVRLRFSGALTGMVLGDLLAPCGMQAADGQTDLRIAAAELSPRGIDRLVASGKCGNISLRALSERCAAGRVSGRATLVITDLTIRDNHLASLDAEFHVEDGPEPKWIEGRLLTNLLGRILDIELPPVLPERIEYTQLGARLEVRDEVLYLFGTHGTRGKTILTGKVMEHEIPLIWEPEQGRDLAGWFDALRTQAAAYVHRWQSLPPRQAWQAFSTLRGAPPPPAPSAPTTSPAPGAVPAAAP